MPHTFGTRLAQQRDCLGLTQAEVCALTSVNRKTQSAYENNKSYPDAAYLTILMHRGFDIIYLLGGDEAVRAGLVNEHLLRDVLIAVDAAVASAAHEVDPLKKAEIAALVYQTSRLAGEVDASVVEKAVHLTA
jgi:transcriptional regulator with XRE-family HTH domain